MSDICDSCVVIAAPQSAAARLAGILSAVGIVPKDIFHEGKRALEAIEPERTMLLTTYRLPDMTGEELARSLGDACEVLMIVPQDYEEDAAGRNVLLLRNPISQDALVQAVRAMAHGQARMAALREQVQRLARTLEERKVVDRAKGRLMDALHLSEAEAYHRIQKQSMDTGRHMADVAREILLSSRNDETT